MLPLRLTVLKIMGINFRYYGEFYKICIINKSTFYNFDYYTIKNINSLNYILICMKQSTKSLVVEPMSNNKGSHFGYFYVT
jgi:hypothetical protein